MENDVLDWAEIKCTKQISPGGSGVKPKGITNRYMIALDVRDVSAEFVCPCCGKELQYEVTQKGNLTKEKKIEIVRDSRNDGLKYLKAFKAVTALIAAASVIGMLARGAVSYSMAGIVILTFIFIWLPGLFFLINRSHVLSSKSSIVDMYIKENPPTVILVEPNAHTHRFEDFPEIPVIEDEDKDYGLV